jgi:hypothetical protein
MRPAVPCTVALAALAVAAAAPSPASALRECGLTPRIDGVRYDVREVRGKVACRRVKRVATQYLRFATAPKPWKCFRGHGTSPFAASCAVGTSVLVRIYAPS